MAIKSKFIIFDTISNFQSSNGINNKTTATNGYYGNVPEGAVVFIKDTGLIWFHGTYFGIDTSLTYATQSWVISQGYTKNTGTVTSIATGAGLTGGTITTSGTIKANLVHETKASFATSETPSNRVTGKSYPVSLDSNGKLMVYVPWTDNNTTSFTITANATDGLWDITGTNGTNAVTYAVGAYLSQLSKASFDTSSTAPTRSDRLNYNGYLYATKLFSGGVEVLTSHQSLSNYYTKTESDNKYVYKSGDTITGNLTVNGNTTLNRYIHINPYDSSYGSNPVSLYWNDVKHTIVGNTKLDGTNNTAVDFLHSGNSSVSKSGETLTVKINGTSYSLTNTNTWNKVSTSQDGYVASIGSGNADSYNKLTSSDQPVVLAFRKGVNGVTDAGWFRLPDNAFLNNTYDLSNYLPLSGGTLNNNAVISRTGTSVTWVNGRLNPIIKTTSCTGYNAILSMKTTNGSWDLGVYSNDTAYLTYITDTNYNSSNNAQTYLLVFPKKSGTIALTSDLSSYLPLTGGTLTGNLEISASDWRTFKITRTDVGWSQFGIDANGLYIYEYDNSTSLANYMYLKGGLGLTLTGHFLPNPSATYNLGSSSYKWNNLYLSNVLSDGTNSLTVANIKSTYDWYQTMTTGNTDGTINKWKEIESFVNGISDTSTLNGILLNYFCYRGTYSSTNIASSIPTQAELSDTSKLNGLYMVSYSGASGTLLNFVGTGSARYVLFYTTYNSGMLWRQSTDANYNTWRTILDSSNYTSYINLSLSGYLPLSGGIMTGTAPIQFTSNTIALSFRTNNHASYDSKVEYMTNGNEALVFANKAAITSFIFKCGYSLTNSSDWYSSAIGTPTVLMKNQSLYVNCAIDNGVTPAYNFYVGGTGYISSNFSVNGLLSVTGAATFNNNVTIRGTLIDLPGLGEGFKIHSDNNYFGENLDGVLFTIKDSNQAAGVDGGIVFRSEATNNGTVTATDWLIMRYAGSNYGTFTWLGKNILHAGNTYISNGVITINGTTITPLTSHQSLANYLPLSGGTMTGIIYLKDWHALIIQKLENTSNYGTAIAWYKGGTSQATYDPLIGHHNTGDTNGSITILPYATETAPYSGSVGLYIGKNTFKWENKTIIHSDNISSYALPLTGGWMTWNSQIYFKGKDNSTSVYSTIGYRTSASGKAMHCISNGNHQTDGAFYITSNGSTSANDTGGLAIDNEGVTVFGAGDAGSNFSGVFRVLNEDNVDDGPQFLVTKSSGATTKYSHTAQRFISNIATGTLPYACTSTTLNTNLNADLLDGLHGSYYATASSLANYVTLNGTQTITGSKTFNNRIILSSGGGIGFVSNVMINDDYTGFYNLHNFVFSKMYNGLTSDIGYVEYYNGSSWVQWTNPPDFAKIFKGELNLGTTTIPYDHRKFRITTRLVGSYLGNGLLDIRFEWINSGTISGTSKISLDYASTNNSSATFTNIFNGLTSSAAYGHFVIPCTIHAAGLAAVRITIELCDWANLNSAELRYIAFGTNFSGKPFFASFDHNHKYIIHSAKTENECIPEVYDSMQSFRCTSSNTGFSDGYILAWRWTSGNYVTQLFADVDANYGLCYRYRASNGNWADWKRIPMGDGTGASGTWGINITGNATTATTATDATYLSLIGNSTSGYQDSAKGKKYCLTGYRLTGLALTASTGDGYLLAFNYNDLFVTQIAVDLDSTYRLAIRNWHYNNGWNDWKNILTNNNTYISNGTITIDGSSITPVTTSSITGYYWANLQISSTTNRKTIPTVKYLNFRKNEDNAEAGWVGAGSSGNNDIGLYAYSGLQLSLGSNGQTVITLDTATNVGIGTTSPGYKLDVSGYVGLYEGLVFTRKSWNYICVPSDNGVLSFNIGGSGTSTTKMMIANNGNVGIGTTSPSYKLDIDGVTRSTTFYINGADNARISGRGTISSTGEEKDLWIYQANNTLRTVIYDARYIHLYSKVRIGTNYSTTTVPEYALEVSGSVSAVDFTATSDIRLKRDIQQISDHVYSFRFKDSDKIHYGFIALELEKNHPDLVGLSEYKTVNYNSALSLYVAELENRVKMLENEINNLKNK